MTPAGKRHTSKANDTIDLLIDLRLRQGYSRESLVDYVLKNLMQKNGKEYSRSRASELVLYAAKEFEARSILNFGKDLKEDIERWEMLGQSYLKEGNKRGYADCLREICKLKGHYASDRLESIDRGRQVTEINLIHIQAPQAQQYLEDNSITFTNQSNLQPLIKIEKGEGNTDGTDR
jgi:predicted Zn-dependent protease